MVHHNICQEERARNNNLKEHSGSNAPYFSKSERSLQQHMSDAITVILLRPSVKNQDQDLLRSLNLKYQKGQCQMKLSWFC